MLMHLKMSRKLLSAVGLATIWTAPSLLCSFGTAAKPNTLALFLTQQRCWAQHLCSVPAPVPPFYSQALWKWVPFPLNPSTAECWVWSAFPSSPVSHTGTKPDSWRLALQLPALFGSSPEFPWKSCWVKLGYLGIHKHYRLKEKKCFKAGLFHSSNETLKDVSQSRVSLRYLSVTF